MLCLGILMLVGPVITLLLHGLEAMLLLTGLWLVAVVVVSLGAWRELA